MCRKPDPREEEENGDAVVGQQRIWMRAGALWERVDVDLKPDEKCSQTLG